MSFFGDYIKTRRLAEHKTLKEVSEQAKISKVSVCLAEKGKTYLHEDSIKKISNLLNISYRELIIRKYLDKIQKNFPEITEKDLIKCLQIFMNY
jgi:transcriptional regulator with XRE-family HTH domain